MKKLAFSFIFIFITTTTFSQDLMKQSAEKFLKSSVNGDTNTMLEFMHPTLIEYLGGKSKMKKIFKANSKDLDKNEVEVISTEIGKPVQEITGESNEYKLFPQYMVMKQGGQKFQVESFILAIKDKESYNWKFINTGNFGNDKIISFFPELKDKLEIPEKEATHISQ